MVGAGGVGDAAARIAVERDFFETLVVADYDLGRAQATVDAASARRPGESRLAAAYVDASDADAVYANVIEIDAAKLEPQVAFPHLPSNVKGVSQAGQIKINQSLIGSCTNGRIEDLRIAAQILKNRKAAPHVRLIVVPATPLIYKQAMAEGLLDTFMDAEAVISPPSCGACLGGHLGILAEGERSVATTNRNFVGRMGHPKSEVYLASPAVAAASAVLGRIASPEEL